mgnify:FL=1|jgi:hypothetical protein|tara:strand:- start:17 stop:244 length:228 start_codon:yes stop_codon:yes gene_type:complete
MSEGWVKELEQELSRKNKVKKLLKKEIDERIEQLRLLEEDTQKVLDDALGGNASREDVEFDLLYERLHQTKGRKK